jgi:hypothetical protein
MDYHCWRMVNWKRSLLIGVGFGAGFALVLVALIAAYVWYDGRPHSEPAWNTTAMKATFSNVQIVTSTPKPYLTFWYNVENTTSSDYIITSNTVLMAIRPSTHTLASDATLSLAETEVYIPAKQKVEIKINKACEYNESYAVEQKDNPDKINPFFNRRLKELDGFVLFDKNRRYKIILPNGWPSAK